MKHAIIFIALIFSPFLIKAAESPAKKPAEKPSGLMIRYDFDSSLPPIYRSPLLQHAEELPTLQAEHGQALVQCIESFDRREMVENLESLLHTAQDKKVPLDFLKRKTIFDVAGPPKSVVSAIVEKFHSIYGRSTLCVASALTDIAKRPHTVFPAVSEEYQTAWNEHKDFIAAKVREITSSLLLALSYKGMQKVSQPVSFKWYKTFKKETPDRQTSTLIMGNAGFDPGRSAVFATVTPTDEIASECYIPSAWVPFPLSEEQGMFKRMFRNYSGMKLIEPANPECKRLFHSPINVGISEPRDEDVFYTIPIIGKNAQGKADFCLLTINTGFHIVRTSKGFTISLRKDTQPGT